MLKLRIDKMKRINKLLKKMLKIDKNITAAEFAHVVNGNKIQIDVRG